VLLSCLEVWVEACPPPLGLTSSIAGALWAERAVNRSQLNPLPPRTTDIRSVGWGLEALIGEELTRAEVAVVRRTISVDDRRARACQRLLRTYASTVDIRLTQSLTYCRPGQGRTIAEIPARPPVVHTALNSWLLPAFYASCHFRGVRLLRRHHVTCSCNPRVTSWYNMKLSNRYPSSDLFAKHR